MKECERRFPSFPNHPRLCNKCLAPNCKERDEIPIFKNPSLLERWKKLNLEGGEKYANPRKGTANSNSYQEVGKFIFFSPTSWGESK